MKKGISFFGGVLILVILLVLGVGLIPIDFAGKKTTNKNYKSIIKDNVGASVRVVDIAMLGAHDAFSDQINFKSEIDPGEAEDSLARNGLVKTLAGGMMVRGLKAQKSNAAELLSHGVRYLDVRLSYHNNDWYTKHARINGKLDTYLEDIVNFLDANSGELVVFDMQHVYLADSSFDSLFAYLEETKFNGKSLIDFVRFNPNQVELGSLTYAAATNGGAGVVILAKTPQKEGCKHYNYENSMRSTWHNKVSDTDMIYGITEEYNTLKEDAALDRNKFRVNQAQKTPSYSAKQIFATILGWSLLDMGNNFNAKLIAHPDFDKWLEVLPIVMVDNADSMKGDFNDKVINKINAFNKSLVG